jgi:hypothetical protein
VADGGGIRRAHRRIRLDRHRSVSGFYAGAAIFDATGGYDAAFIAMLGSAVAALALTLLLRRAAK